MDKNKSLINYLITCEAIMNSPLYLNFVNAKNGVHQIQTIESDKNINNPYIDGSVKKRYSLTLITYLTISQNPLVKVENINNENVADLDTVQKLMDWIDEQNTNHNYPDFGTECEIDEIGTTTNNPRLDQIDATQSNPLARYSFTIYVDYLDKSKMIWN